MTSKILVLAFALVATSTPASSSAYGGCTGEFVDCFDQETQKWKSFLHANTCEDYHDGKRWITRAYCSKEGTSPSNCTGKSVDCFDQETQSYKTFPHADTCEDYHNGTRWITRAYCK